jgi:6-phosphogluconolactonase
MTGSRWVCVSHADSGDLWLLSMAQDGALQPQQRLSLGGQLMPMAQSPCGARLYVARRSDPMAVISLALDRQAQRLTVLGEAALPASMAYLCIDRTGRYLLAASYQGHLLSVSPIASDGRVGAVQQVVGTPANAHAVLATPSNAHVLATSLGGDAVMQFVFDAASGRLTANEPAQWSAPSGAGPRHLRFHPMGRCVYLLNELDATLQVLAFDPGRGVLEAVQSLSILPPGFAGKPWAADVQITPDGRFIYCSERTSSCVAHLALSPDGRKARVMGHLATEQQPRGMAIDHEGAHLLVVGQLSNHLSRYRIDPSSGQLTAVQRLPLGQNPNWIEVMS